MLKPHQLKRATDFQKNFGSGRDGEERGGDSTKPPLPGERVARILEAGVPTEPVGVITINLIQNPTTHAWLLLRNQIK